MLTYAFDRPPAGPPDAADWAQPGPFAPGGTRALGARGADPGVDERLLRTVVDTVPLLMSYLGTDLRNVVGNAAYLDWFGLSPQEMRGMHARDILGDELYEQNAPYLDRVLTGQPQRFERRFVDRNGTRRIARASYSPDIQGGRVVGFSVLVQDVTVSAEGDATPSPSDGPVHLGPCTQVRALVVDGDALTRAGLRAYLASAPEIDVVGEAASADEALAAVEASRPHVVVMDARLPGMDVFLAPRKTPAGHGSTFPKVVALLTSALDELIVGPVSTVLSKHALPQELIEGVLATARGQSTGLDRQRHRPPGSLCVDRTWRPTSRERDVLDLVVRGFSNRDIAQQLFVSVDTVKTHLRHIYAKLGVRSRQQLIIASFN